MNLLSLIRVDIRSFPQEEDKSNVQRLIDITSILFLVKPIYGLRIFWYFLRKSCATGTRRILRLKKQVCMK